MLTNFEEISKIDVKYCKIQFVQSINQVDPLTYYLKVNSISVNGDDCDVLQIRFNESLQIDGNYGDINITKSFDPDFFWLYEDRFTSKEIIVTPMEEEEFYSETKIFEDAIEAARNVLIKSDKK